MSKVTDQLREVGVFNPHNYSTRTRQLGGVGLYIAYRPEDRGRAYRPAAWQVIDPASQTDPGGHWMDAGHKTFSVHGRESKSAERANALAWAEERYGISEWVPGPFAGTLVPAEDKRLLRAIREGVGA